MGPTTTTLSPAAVLLPKELMELQLGQIDLLMAMYPSEGEVLLEESARDVLGTLRDWCGEDSVSNGDNCPTHLHHNIPPDISVVLNLEVVAEDDPSPSSRRLQLDITWPLRCAANAAADAPAAAAEPPNPRVRIRQPDWLSRAETSRLAAAEIPPEFKGGDDRDDGGDGDILGAIERIREAAAEEANSNGNNASILGAEEETGFLGGGADPDPLVRAWFYFPSISTRAKRDDLVAHAPGYGLTGFLLAGKPGVLCVEGGARAIDAYMRFIKTESWGDIPAHQKKVSERWREELDGSRESLKRAFPDMSEITDTLGGGAKRGERANRSDMKALEAWLVDRGLGEAFSRVFI